MNDETDAVVKSHFDDQKQQLHAATLGMWVFLATEVLFFGGLFLAYLVYHSTYPESFIRGSHRMEMFIGSSNTAILLTSSLTMALSVETARHGKRREKYKRLMMFLVATIVLGVIFLGLKGVEYYKHYQDGLVPGAGFRDVGVDAKSFELFFFLYFAMTGLHAVHMTVGVGVLSVLTFRAWKADQNRLSPEANLPNAVDMAGLYWHFVDIVWIFLYPAFYLLERYK